MTHSNDNSPESPAAAKLPYVPPKMETLDLSVEAAEALT